jgi:hypothetical protein
VPPVEEAGADESGLRPRRHERHRGPRRRGRGRWAAKGRRHDGRVCACCVSKRRGPAIRRVHRCLGRRCRLVGHRLGSKRRHLGRKVARKSGSGRSHPRRRRNHLRTSASEPPMIPREPGPALTARRERRMRPGRAVASRRPGRARKSRRAHARAGLHGEPPGVQKPIQRQRLWPWACGCAGQPGAWLFWAQGLRRWRRTMTRRSWEEGP